MNASRRTALIAATAVALAALLAIAPLSGLAGYLESDYPDQQVRPQPQPEPQPRPLPPPRPEPPPVVDNPTTRLVRDVQVGEPIRWGHLVLFPLTLPGAEPVARIHPLGTAVDRGWVSIEEDTPPTVARATLVNSSGELVLVLAGELIKGGRQHRSSRQDLLLLPHSRVAIDLYCVEQGRWRGPARFEAAKALAPQSIRAGNVAGAEQARVWEDVRTFNEAAGAAGGTQDLLSGLDAAKVREELADCRRIVLPRLPDDCVGLAAGRAGRVFAADVFVDRELFAACRRMLIDSYASQEVYHKLLPPRPSPRPDPRMQEEPRDQDDLEAPQLQPGRVIRPPQPPTQQQARLFLARALRAQFTALATPGGGRVWRIVGAATGQALDYRGQSVHVALTSPMPVPVVRPLPRPEPPPVPLPRPIPRPEPMPRSD